MSDLESLYLVKSMYDIQKNFQNISMLFYALLLFMILDYITGVLVAIVHKKIDSKIGFVGILKKFFILLIFVMGLTIDTLIIGQGQMVTLVIVSFYIANEGFSILENAEKINIPLPQKLLEILEQIKNQKKLQNLLKSMFTILEKIAL